MDEVAATPAQRLIRQTAEASRDASIAFLQNLIRAQQDGEDAVQGVVAAAARAAGCEVETLSYRPAEIPMIEEFAGTEAIDTGERRAVVARRHGSGNGRSLMLFAHPDGEPVAATERWRSDPFVGEIANGRIHGWGVADDLAGVAIMIEALRIVAASGLALQGDIVAASTPSKRHARGVSALLHGGLTADAAIYLHPAESGAGMAEVKAFCSGQVEFRIIVEGGQPPTTEPLQAAFAHLAENPIEKMQIVAEALRVLGERRAGRTHSAPLEAVVGRSTNLMPSFVASGERHRLARLPERCEMGFALSFPPPERLSEVVAEIEATIAGAAAADPWLAAHPPTIVWDSGVTGAQIDAGHPLFVTAAAAIAAVTGTAPLVNPMHTGSDIRNPIVQKGIPTIGLGPLCGDLSQNGGTDEWVDVADYLRAVAVVAEIMIAWSGAAG
jgi:acetylornithine deacetylase